MTPTSPAAAGPARSAPASQAAETAPTTAAPASARTNGATARHGGDTAADNATAAFASVLDGLAETGSADHDTRANAKPSGGKGDKSTKDGKGAHRAVDDDTSIANSVLALINLGQAATPPASTTHPADTAAVSDSAAPQKTALAAALARLIDGTEPTPADDHGAAANPGSKSADITHSILGGATGTGSGASAGDAANAASGNGGHAEAGKNLSTLLSSLSGGKDHDTAALLKTLIASAGDKPAATSRDGSPSPLNVGAPTVTPTALASLPTVTRTIETPVTHPQWAQAVAEAVIDASGPDGTRLRLQVHPADLGPVDIALDIHHDRAKVQISALHETTRAALQSALPQLTAMLASEGLNLTQADVGSQTQSQSQPAPPAQDPPAVGGVASASGSDTLALRAIRLRDGLIDDYA